MSNHEKMVKKFWKSMDDSPFVMLSLVGVDEAHSQPMTAQIDPDLNDCLYFYTNRTNRLVEALGESHSGVINFSAKGHGLFACVHGTMTTSNDKAIVEKFWSPIVAAWYENGKEDTDLVMLRFDLKSAEIWNASATNFFRAMIAGHLGSGAAADAASDDVVTVNF